MRERKGEHINLVERVCVIESGKGRSSKKPNRKREVFLFAGGVKL